MSLATLQIDDRVEQVVAGLGSVLRMITDAAGYAEHLHYLVGFAYGAAYEVMEIEHDPRPVAGWPPGDAIEFRPGVRAGRRAISSDTELLDLARSHIHDTGDPAELLNSFWQHVTSDVDGAHGPTLRATTLAWPQVGH
jgi:hypothetical protein